jgi:hypothetical protein
MFACVESEMAALYLNGISLELRPVVKVGEFDLSTSRAQIINCDLVENLMIHIAHLQNG